MIFSFFTDLSLSSGSVVDHFGEKPVKPRKLHPTHIVILHTGIHVENSLFLIIKNATLILVFFIGYSTRYIHRWLRGKRRQCGEK